jgi:hypothetical protein
MSDLRKPAKGSGLIARKLSKNARRAFEERQKKIVRKRDQRCRWPRCENCRLYKPRLEVAHLVAKGIGGDPRNTKSTADQMILLDYLTHQGPDGLEQHGRWIDPVTDRGTAGPCEFWAKDDRGDWYLVARELGPFYY